METEDIKAIIGLILIIASFILGAFLIQEYSSVFENYFNLGYFGMFVFVVLVAASDVFIVVSAIPLFPLATSLWGVFVAAILGAIGWTIGGVIAFIIARKYGVDLVGKLVPIKQIYKLEKKIPERNLFLVVMLSRMVLPLDGVSYLLGLFSKMSLRSFTLATLLGIIPFSFALAYLGEIPWQIMLIITITFLLAIILIELIILFKKKIKSKR